MGMTDNEFYSEVMPEFRRSVRDALYAVSVNELDMAEVYDCALHATCNCFGLRREWLDEQLGAVFSVVGAPSSWESFITDKAYRV